MKKKFVQSSCCCFELDGVGSRRIGESELEMSLRVEKMKKKCTRYTFEGFCFRVREFTIY